MSALKPENKFSQWVRRGLRAQGCIVEPIENRVNLGIPDLLVNVDGTLALIELKVVQRGLVAGLRPHQVAFHIRHQNAPTFVMIHQYANKKHGDYVHLYLGAQCMALQEIGLKEEPLFTWDYKKIMWEDVKYILKKDRQAKI